VKALRTIIDVRKGMIFHILFGLLAGILGCKLVFTLIFLFKQVLDLLSGEDPSIVSGEVAEYASGLIAGLIIRMVVIL